MLEWWPHVFFDLDPKRGFLCACGEPARYKFIGDREDWVSVHVCLKCLPCEECREEEGLDG